MEEADKVCSAAPDAAPHGVAVNGAAAAGETRADEPLPSAEEKTSAEITSAEITSAVITSAVITSAPLTPEGTSESKAAEVTSTSQTAEETSALQTTEITSTSKTTEETSALQMTEVTSTSQTAEETGTPQTTEKTSSPEITEITSSPTEVTSAPQAAEETISQTTEKTSSPEITSTTTEVTSEETISQTTEEISSPQITEVTSSPQTTEETSSPRITEVTSSPRITEVTSSPQTTEGTSSPQITEVTSSPQITEVTGEASSSSAAQAAAVTSPPEAPAEESAAAPSSPSASARQQDPSSSAAAEERLPPASSSEPPASAEQETSSPTAAAGAREPDSHLREPDPDAPAPPAAHEPGPPSAPALLQQLPSDRWESPSVASANTDLTMDPFRLKDSPALDPDLLSQSDDDLMFETKKSPFQQFSPVSDGEAAGSAVSDSPSPDLVQDAYDEELRPDATAPLSYASSDLCSSANADDRPMSLPDILKSSPLNPDKVDSGSSEGSPDFSPVHRSVHESPISPPSASAGSPFGPDKILLLKEMVEDTEAKAAEKAKLEVESGSEQGFVAFDLLKEMDVPAASESPATALIQAPVSDHFQSLSFPSRTQETWDSESPSADSFSPVLDAETQKPTSFPAEPESRAQAPDEVSEPEASSEEFEFVERPPHGAQDEFLETQDSPTLVKPSELLMDEERPPQAGDPESGAEDAHSRSSPQPLSRAWAGPVTGNAGLEAEPREDSAAPASVDHTGAPGLSADAVRELLYWRDVRSSALALGSCLVLLLSLLSCSIISVVSYSSLALLSATVSFRTYRGVVQAVQKSNEGHPFRAYLERDVCVSQDAVHKHSELVLSRINGALKELRRLFLVEDLIDSLKFAGLLYVLTYVGSWFNGLTLLILALVGAFSGPIVYERHQAQIDHLVSVVNAQIRDVLGKIQAKVPGAPKKTE